MISSLFRQTLLAAGKILGDTSMDVYRKDFDDCAPTYDDVATRPLLAAIGAEKIAGLGIARGTRCIELGCGTGQVTELLAKAAGEGAVAACDISRPMIGKTGERLARAGLDAVLAVSDMAEFLKALPTAGADLAVAFWSLEYRDPALVLHEARRALAGGGRIAVLVNTRASLSELQAVATGVLVRHPLALRRIPPLNFPAGAASFRKTAERAGLATLSLSEGSCGYRFADGDSLVAWMKAGGPASGFRSAIRETYIEHIYSHIKEAVDKSGGLTVRFRYLYYEGAPNVPR